MARGLFITLEGLDGSGKTTQIKRLAAWLEKRGLQPVITRQPGGTLIGDRIREILLDARSTGLAPFTEMALMFADRAQAIAEVIQPALDAGKVVLCDRFTDSTEAYQGGGRELGSAVVLDLHRLICGNLQPDLTLLLLPSLDASPRPRPPPQLPRRSSNRQKRKPLRAGAGRLPPPRLAEVPRNLRPRTQPCRPHPRRPRHRRNPGANRRSRRRAPHPRRAKWLDQIAL